ncbi:MAG: alcohol dehydrogenase catalytic domain-containing protein [Dehalococcoidales bacterium]|nr:alcohol dehydrogenase catalytic domain-containing protein [Dehalococcoidales bacterium]
MMQMKAAIYHGPGDIRIEEIERPVAGDHGIVLRVRASGICPLMDLPRYKKKLLDCATGIALGHEFSGDVVEIGPGVTEVKPGDKVHGLSFRPCYHCDNCRSGDYGRCRNFTSGTSGTWINGSFAEYLEFPFVSQGNIIRLPDNISHRDGALIEPLGIGIGLADKAGAGDVVAVLGQEFNGLATLACLKRKGVAKVIVCDESPLRLEKSRELGADIVINSLDTDLAETVMEVTSGKGVDVVIETAGLPATFRQAIDIVREHGHVWLGSFYDGPFMFDPSFQRPDRPHSNLTQKGGMAIHCAWMTLGDRMERRQQAVEMIQAGIMTAGKFVTGVFPLDQTTEAFEKALNPDESIKILVEP